MQFGTKIDQYNPRLNLVRRLVAKHNPKRILITNRWIGYHCKTNLMNSKCKMNGAKKHIT